MDRIIALAVSALVAEAALLEAEVGNEPVDGGLLGMAAAQAGDARVVLGSCLGK